ncbi:hypothetical protein GLOIN_2v1773854 [Rhizophagus irregularis DAOM 181602=DAOM 197198]|uniref:Uncharacterized protein n=1 Tax=Rhizophagus irregularis (strain DAOM 181602 / DAOM 197198 / MUCL 43194) TaxID=747089 RepID=A0A2P4Q3Y1_RHIID|nr:hypothetical protein GLOIN_2v1773854 [Rhizophagus irregularis DAOM 181602=DAOM 197198]POG72326.1 hypothetical protein GLOIN_2v1773854 [Rhizophagus irregularis DAOM 181602=DAOM 197198]|eukprot:XP_025179192.1 hypothetical protein GLOIN_2v1773854 [Rhizophagus irregularis DAOM 181602=DAOM 197198]
MSDIYKKINELSLKKKEIINLKSYLVGNIHSTVQLQLALASCESKEEENGHDKKRLRVKEPGSSILLAAADNNTVELSSIIYEMLMSNKYKPDPHSEFTSLLNVKTAMKVCQCFFALNKDILAFTDLGELMIAVTEDDPDSHEALLNNETLVLERLKSLQSLTNLNFWDEAKNGTRVIYTGTTHARFEKVYLKNRMQE